MQIESLKVFCDVVRFRSFSRGARENKVTQSCASQTVHQLEQRLGASLIDRFHRPWKLTPAGRAFYEGCRDLVERFAEIENQVRGFRHETSSLIKVAAIYSVGLGPMNQFIQKFSELHPQARVRIEYLHPDRVYQKVLEGEADLGIVSFPKAGRRFTVTPWRYERMVIAAPPGHPISREKEVDLSRISGERFVGLDQGLVIRREIDRFLKHRGVTVDVVQEFDNIEAVKRAVEVGSGISILPRVTLEREIEMGTLRAVSFPGKPLVRPMGLLQRRGRRAGTNAALFVRLLRQEKGNEDSKAAP
jgi:DNA-binding transcriptional LysR family regulator